MKTKMKTKICNRCKCDFPLKKEYFNIRKGGKDGFRSICKLCMKISNKKYYLDHKDELSKLARSRYIRNREKIKAQVKKYSVEHKKEIKEYREKNKNKYRAYNREYCKRYNLSHKKEFRAYRIKNKNRIRLAWKKYAQEHKKELSIKHRRYGMENREKIRNYIRARRKTDVKFRIVNALRRRLSRAIKSQGATKSKHTKELVGCSIINLIKHLESQFLPGMTWNNYGLYGWHIDHIKPCASFDLVKPKEQRKCFNWKNLCPMWWLDNLHKSSFYNGKYISKRRKLCQLL